MSRLACLFLFALISANAFGQINVRYVSARKPYYHRGDTIRVAVVMRLNPKSCLDGMRKTYLYFSGCEEVHKAPWRRLPNDLFEKEMTLRIARDTKNKARLTITRNTDKDAYFRQETFNIK